MNAKPSSCKGCRLEPYGAGFLQDTTPLRPITLVRYLLPNEHIQLERHFPAGTDWGNDVREFLINTLKLNNERELDNLVGYSYLIRCFLGTVRNHLNQLVDMGFKAESSLMQEVQTCKDKYDRNEYRIITFSYDFLDAIETPAYTSVVEAILRKAYRLHLKHQCKVAIYMGDKCLKHVLPHAQGGMNKWVGHMLVKGAL